MSASPRRNDFADSDDEAYIKAIGDFKPGSITKIKLTNFMTHSSAEILPGPRLNMVIGANGTGKSTILNAICLGLGGDPKLLGRADDLRAFIRHGCTVAKIEIHLAPHPEQELHVFTRVLDADKGSQSRTSKGKGSSTCYINGEKASVKQVRQIVSEKYQIAIDNLCTFLPQDKVGSFSGFSDQERLIESEKTFQGGNENQYYFNLHQQLIQAEDELLSSTGNVDTVQEKLDKLNHELGQLEREKERMEERERAIEQRTLYRQKKLWLAFEELRDRTVEAKDRRDEIKQKVKAVKEMLRPLEERYTQCSTAKKEFEARLAQLEQQAKKHRTAMGTQTTKYEKHDEQVDECMVQLTQIETQRSKLENEYEEAKKKLNEYQEAFANSASEERIEQELASANTNARQARHAYDQAKRELRLKMHTLNEIESRAKDLQTKLARLNNDADRRKERIFRMYPDLAKVSEWLDQNRAQFRRNVWGPVVCEVSAKSHNASAFLEFHAPNKILRAYVVETKEDYDKLYDVARQQLKVPINVIQVQNGRLKEIRRLYSDQKMQVLKQTYGVKGYLDESFTAPDPVLQCLRDWAGVDKVLVRGEEKRVQKDILDYLMEPDPGAVDPSKVPKGAVVISSRGDKSFRYTVNRSRFAASLAIKTDDIPQAKMLAPGTNPSAKKKLEDELAAVHGEMDEFRPSLQETQQSVSGLEEASQQAGLDLQHAKKMKENLLKFQSKVKRAQNRVDDLEKALNQDDHEEKKKLVKQLMNRMSHCVKALETHKEERRQLIENMISSAGFTLGKQKATAEERAAKQELHERQQENKALEEEGTRLQQEFKNLRQKLTQAKTAAQSEAPLEDREGNPLPLKAKLEALEVSTLAEVEAALEDVEQTISSIQANDGVFRQYEKLQLEVAEVEEQLQQLTSSKDAKLALIAERRKPWETAITNNIYKTNVKFSKYMEEMGCTGEVRLKKGSTDESDGENVFANFKDWGIEILVSYRENTKAQILSAERHSGGERSVATILYLMALQDAMVAPFRCVDEINQGLDERNERLVFKRIVANSTSPPRNNDPFAHSGQYFLITPKLLDFMTDMENEAVTIQIVMNGGLNFINPTDWHAENLMIVGDRSGKRPLVTEADSENSQNGVRQRKKKSRRSEALVEAEH